MTLHQNVTDYHSQIEQAAFEPNNLVAGTGLSPDKMLLARGFSYSDAHRARLGVNYRQIPVNTPKAPVNSYSKDGAMRIIPVSDPVYAPNSYGGPVADPDRTDDGGTWASDLGFQRSLQHLTFQGVAHVVIERSSASWYRCAPVVVVGVGVVGAPGRLSDSSSGLLCVRG